MIDFRIYRAAFVPALLAIIVVMFSVEARPGPLVSTLAPDAFDDEGAAATARDLMERYPDRRAGSDGDAAVGQLVRGRFESLGFETRTDRFKAEVDGEQASLGNVVGVLSGVSERQIVLLAHRDAAERPGAASATATGTLLELASALAGVRHEKTIVFVSTDGAHADSAGARRFAASYADRGQVDAAIVLDDVAAGQTRKPYVVGWSSDSGRPSLQLVRSAERTVARELGSVGGSESFVGQFVRQAWPLALREQGPLVDGGFPAVTLTSRGESPRDPESDVPAAQSTTRLLQFGKAALGTVLAVDAGGELEPSPRSYIVFARNVIPGWAVALLAMALLAPALVTALDGAARARRRGLPIGGWVRWVLATAVPFLIVVLTARIFDLFGWLPATASEAIAAPSRPTSAESLPALAALVLLLALAWLVARPLALGRRRALGSPSGPEAAVALALVLSIAVLALWVTNPFAALLLVPAAHLCLLGALPQSPRRSLLAAGAVLAALLLPVLVLAYYGTRLDLGLDLTRYALLVLTSGDGLWNALLASLLAGSMVSTVLVALSRSARPEAVTVTVRGPRSYAGPGSLGGTESALRR